MSGSGKPGPAPPSRFGEQFCLPHSGPEEDAVRPQPRGGAQRAGAHTTRPAWPGRGPRAQSSDSAQVTLT